MSRYTRSMESSDTEIFEATVPFYRGLLCTRNGNGFFLANSSFWYVLFPWSELVYDDIVKEWVYYRKFRLCLGRLRFHLGFAKSNAGVNIWGRFYHPNNGPRRKNEV